MNLHKVTKASEVILAGITIELEMRDGSLYGVVLTDSKGGFAKIAKSSYSDLDIYIIAPPKKVKKFKLAGTLNEVAKVEELFPTEYEATARKQEIERKFDHSDGVLLTIAEVEVEEEA